MDFSSHEDGLSVQDKETAINDGYIDKKKDAYFWQKRRLKVTVKGWHYCCAFCLSAVMSGQFVGYNPGLAAGVGGFTLCVILISIGYILLGACIGELASAIPFCGGSYGYTRFVFGKVPGFIIGVIESFEYWFLITTNGYFAGQLVCLITGTPDKYLPLWWLIIYSIVCGLQLRGGKLMWDVVNIICVFNILVLVIFFFATTKWMDMNKNGPIPGNSPWFTTDASVFFQSFPFAIWMFIGVEVIPMISEEVEEPHKNVPKGIRGAVWCLAICSMFIMLNVASLPPPDHGTLLDTASAPFPCQQGWALVFGKDSNLSVILSFLPIFNVVYGTGIGASRQLFAMSRSGYLPAFLSLTSERGVPYVASSLLAISCFLLSIIVNISSNPTRFFNALFNVSTITGISNYIVQLSCFIVWRYRHTSITRQYRSPYGVPGAVIAICIFGVGLGAMFAYTPHVTDAVIALAVFLVILCIYYVTYARHHLTLSPEEIHALFPVYSYMILEGKWKKVHTQQPRRDSLGLSKTNMSATPQPKVGGTVELEPINNSRKENSRKENSRKEQVTEDSNRPLFNPFALDPHLEQSQNDSTLADSKVPTLDSSNPLVLDSQAELPAATSLSQLPETPLPDEASPVADV